MVRKWLLRVVRGRVRTAITLAVLPLAIMNGLPIAAGCICADGHYEPVCHASLCHNSKGDCGRPCCAHHNCCNGASACCQQYPAPLKDGRGHRVNRCPCCTPVVHEAIPTIIKSSQLLDVQPLPALVVAAIELPSSLAIAAIGHQIDFDTGPPPDDLVITLRRLVI
jgi:hypothetical protein